MKSILKVCLAVAMVFIASACNFKRSGNPVVEGWYADPEGVIFGDTYWINLP